MRRYRRENREKIAAHHKSYLQAWRKKHGTFKDKIRKIARYALERGRLIKGSCEVCQSPKVEMHHDSYRREHTLKVRWLCKIHHREVDVEQGRRKF